MPYNQQGVAKRRDAEKVRELDMERERSETPPEPHRCATVYPVICPAPEACASWREINRGRIGAFGSLPGDYRRASTSLEVAPASREVRKWKVGLAPPLPSARVAIPRLRQKMGLAANAIQPSSLLFSF